MECEVYGATLARMLEIPLMVGAVFPITHTALTLTLPATSHMLMTQPAADASVVGDNTSPLSSGSPATMTAVGALAEAEELFKSDAMTTRYRFSRASATDPGWATTDIDVLPEGTTKQDLGYT